MRAALIVATSLVFAATALAGSPPKPVETAVVATGAAPCGIVAARDGGLWVGVYGTGKVLRIDPFRGKVTTKVRVGRYACRVVVGPAAVWVTRDRAGELVRISRGTGRLARLQVGAGAFDVVLARGSVWVTSFDIGIIAEVDAATTRLRRVYHELRGIGHPPLHAVATSGRMRAWPSRPPSVRFGSSSVIII